MSCSVEGGAAGSWAPGKRGSGSPGMFPQPNIISTGTGPLALTGSTTAIVLCYAAIVGSILVSYARARAEGIGLTLREGLFTRAERVLLLGGALVVAHGVVVWALWVLAVLSHVTAVQRVVTVWQRLSTDDGV